MVGPAPSGFGSLLSRATKPWARIPLGSPSKRGGAGRLGEARRGAGRLTQTTAGRPELEEKEEQQEEEEKEGQEEGKSGARRTGGGGARREEEKRGIGKEGERL